MKTYYDVLRVERDATQDEVKRAFRVRVKELHPDTNRESAGSADEMTELLTAYQTLNNPEARSEYDRLHGRQQSERQFDFREFLRRQGDAESQARLIFYDLLHDNPEDALELYDTLMRISDFDLAEYLGREDFMDCAFLLAEEYEERGSFLQAFDLLAAIVRFERQRPYFKHFMEEVVERLRTVVCFKMAGSEEADTVLPALEQMIAWNFSNKETAFYLKKAAELYVEKGDFDRANRYLTRGLELDSKLSGIKKLKERLAAGAAS
ncbi:MAG: J domain-containing protein [Alkalispirochaetaceae bacterium]